MSEIVIIGGGGHAKVVASVLKKCGYDILGYTDPRNCGAILGVPYLGDDEVLAELVKTHIDCEAVIGVGKTDASAGRSRLLERIHTLGFALPVLVSPRAVVNEEVQLGSGTVVFDGAVVSSGAVAGDCCIINTNCTVEHDCHLGDNVHVAPAAALSGGVAIGANTMVGTGALVVQNVTIVADCMIGAGSTVLGNITAPGTYAGSPARRIR
jgi:sugar O-acyltransferase (sialic acid O-acetyltransferase NeuD family)